MHLINYVALDFQKIIFIFYKKQIFECNNNEKVCIVKRKTRMNIYSEIFLSINYLNPLLPSVPYMALLAKILILILEGITKNISYEYRDYESVHKKNYLKPCPEKRRKKIQTVIAQRFLNKEILLKFPPK